MSTPANNDIRALFETTDLINGRFSNICRMGTSSHGQFSWMFTAEDQVAKKSVALKVLNPFENNAYRVLSFEREEKLLRRFQGQPNVLCWISGMHEIDISLESPGPPRVTYPVPCKYFAVDLAEIDVREAIVNARWSHIELLSAFREMCKGIQRLHRQGIVHRDLKPDNFLVEGDSVLVSDLGTATEVEPNWNPLVGVYATFYPGDRRYRAPETKFGLCDEDPRTLYKADMFALGAILFEMWTNTPLLPALGPHVIEAMETAMIGRKPGQHIRQFDAHIATITSDFPLPSIMALGSSVPRSIRNRLDQLYWRMASFDYRQRPSNFDEIFRQLDICTKILQYEKNRQRRRGLRRSFREPWEQ